MAVSFEGDLKEKGLKLALIDRLGAADGFEGDLKEKGLKPAGQVAYKWNDVLKET